MMEQIEKVQTPPRIPEMNDPIFGEIYRSANVDMIHEFDDAYRHLASTIKQSVPVRSFERILEVGCGVGLLGKHLSFQFPDSEIICEDIDEKSIAFAEENFRIRKLGFRTGDVYTLSERDSGIDLVIVNDSMHHFNDLGHALGEIHGALGQRGYLISIDMDRTGFYNGWYQTEDVQQMADLLMSLRTTFDEGTTLKILENDGLMHRSGDFITAVMSGMAAYTRSEMELGLKSAGYSKYLTYPQLNRHVAFAQK